MRVQSVAGSLGKYDTVESRKTPRVGTKLRELWDLLHEYRGEVFVDSLDTRFGHSRIDQLKDFYGLDIRCLGKTYRSGLRGRGPGRWVLAGEWFGPVYVDYVAGNKKRLEKMAEVVNKDGIVQS